MPEHEIAFLLRIMKQYFPHGSVPDEHFLDVLEIMITNRFLTQKLALRFSVGEKLWYLTSISDLEKKDDTK